MDTLHKSVSCYTPESSVTQMPIRGSIAPNLVLSNGELYYVQGWRKQLKSEFAVKYVNPIL